jgi:UDP:flavonoid glycosyltransferase YjiC (YdhE family)
MHITILAFGSRGDIQPYAALGSGLVNTGHQVRFITFESFSEIIAANGLDFHPVQGNPRFLVSNAGPNILSLARSFGSLAEGYARNLSDPKLGETDLFINQLPGGLYGYDLAEKYGFPMIRAAVMPLSRTKAFPLMGFPKLPLPGYNRGTYFIGEQIVWLMFRGAINRWRKNKLRLPPAPFAGYFNQEGTAQYPTLYGFSPTVVPRPPDWGDSINITGYWFMKDKNWQPPKDLEKFLNNGPPPVYIGFGSMPVKNPTNTTQVILESLQQTGQRGIIHTGWGGLGNQKLPGSVYMLDYAPHDWLFPRMAMVIHHGGSGTTGVGLRAGVPSCVVPFVFDQHYWGDRLHKLGVGPKPLGWRDFSVKRLSHAIRLGTRDTQIRQKAAKIGEAIRAEDGINNAREIINKIFG